MKKLPLKLNTWQTLSKKEIFDNPWIHVEAHDVVNPNGGKGDYGVIHFKNLAIGIIPLDDELNTWIVGQWRYPLGHYSWEIPEGGGKLNVEPIESAKRELLEETGIKAKHWDKVLEMDLSNSVSDERGYVFVARGLEFGEAQPDEDEDLEIKKIPFEELYQRTVNGEIRDGLAVAGILRVKLMIDHNEI
ncbi:MAG: NUDIX hydrolase [Flavobacteriales bacterium]|nr:NUDIX hydrolase [Flavobacteriales bacterium]